MSLENTNAENDRAIQAAADILIRQAAERKGWTIDQIPQEAKDYANQCARESVESEAAKASNPYVALYEQEKARRELAEKQLGVVRENRTARTDTRVVDTMERVRDTMGRATWFQLSRDQKVASLGVEPSSVDMVQLRKLFSKETDTGYAVDYAKVNPFRYRQLREVAKALDITGK